MQKMASWQLFVATLLQLMGTNVRKTHCTQLLRKYKKLGLICGTLRASMISNQVKLLEIDLEMIGAQFSKWRLAMPIAAFLYATKE